MNNRIWRPHPPASIQNSAASSRFELIRPCFPQAGPLTGPLDLHTIAFLHARATVELARWKRLLRKIFEVENLDD